MVLPNFIPDGRIHRFKGQSGKSAWYVSHGSWGAWGDWATGEKHTFKDDECNWEAVKIENRKRRKDTLIRQKQVALECLDIWENKADHTIRHNYLIRKQIREYVEKWYEADLLIPVCDIKGKIWNLQKINASGKKLFVKGGRKKGCMFRMGEIINNVIVCEGYATGASIHQITGLPAIVAFDAYNLFDVCQQIVRLYPLSSVYIAADDDAWKPHIGNTGIREASKCHSELHVGIIKPEFKQPHHSLKDFNDLQIAEGKEAVYRQFKFLMEQT